MIQLVVEGLPVPWAAHGGYGRRSFNPRFKEKEYAVWQMRSEYNQNKPLTGPVELDITYHMPIPQGTSKPRRSQMLAGRIHHIKRPDLDNLNKFICDAMKKLVYEDDSQIFKITARKIYGECGKTVIRVIDANNVGNYTSDLIVS